MPYCFEFKAITGERMFLEVVSTSINHYTGEKMRYCRVHSVCDGGGKMAYMFLNDAQWLAALCRRIKDGDQEKD